jgi:hypothetical protein
VADRNGVCVATNDAYRRLVHAETLNETLGSAWLALVPDGYELDAARSWNEGVQSGKDFTIKTRILPRRGDAKVIPIIIRATPLLTSKDKLVGYAGILALDETRVEVPMHEWAEQLIVTMSGAFAALARVASSITPHLHHWRFVL